MALRKSDLRIDHVSENTAMFIARRPEVLLGRELGRVLPQARSILFGQRHFSLREHAEYMGDLALARRSNRFAIHVHEADGMAIAEFEPVHGAANAARAHGMVQSVLESMHAAAAPEDVCQLVVRCLKRLTGFGSVLACTLPANGEPRVIAERVDAGYERYAERRYPIADVPACAMSRLGRASLHVVRDARAIGAELVSGSGDDVTRAPDLQGALLGCLQPELVGWIREVGGRSALILPLRVAGRSWGLVVCTDAHVKTVSMTTRMACDVIARSASLQIEALGRLGRRKACVDELERPRADRSASREGRGEPEEFSFSASHEIQAPLRQILSYTELLEQSTTARLSGQDGHYLANIGKAARRAHTLVEDLLGFSRVGSESLHYSDVNLGGLVELNRVELAAEAADRHVQWQVDPLPKVRADASLMNVVLRNLLSNALKYTRGRDPSVIHIGALEHHDETVIFVRDNGVGFDMQYGNRLFEVFQRLHRTENFEGTGIGLATVRRIIEHHHGRVWADAELGKGATFFFSLPLPAL